MLKGLAYLATHPVDIVVFLDGDYSDYPDEMSRLVEPIQRGESDMVLSTRLNPMFDKTALPPHVVYGNRFWFSTNFLEPDTRIGPVSRHKIRRLDATANGRLQLRLMVEMQIKAKLRSEDMEIPALPETYRSIEDFRDHSWHGPRRQQDSLHDLPPLFYWKAHILTTTR
jgi:hypothetical protein